LNTVEGSRQHRDQYHAPTLALRALPQGSSRESFALISVILLGRQYGVLFGDLHAKQLAAVVELFLPVAVSQETVVANSLEPAR
jgi:hypothetical protein